MRAVALTNVIPDCLQMQTESCKVVDDVLYHGPILVTPSTLVEAKSPVLLHCWKTDSTAGILLSDIARSWTVEEVEVDRTTESTPCDRLWL